MVTTVTDNSPQSINTSLFSLEKEIVTLLGNIEKIKSEIEAVSDVANKTAKAIEKINTEGTVISVNDKQGIVTLDAADVGALPDTTTIPSKTSQLTNDSDFATNSGDLGGLKLYVAYEGGSSVSISYGLFFYGSENGNVFKLFTSPTTVTPSNSFWGDPAPGDNKIMIGLYR